MNIYKKEGTIQRKYQDENGNEIEIGNVEGVKMLLSKYNQFPKHELKSMGRMSQ